MTRKEIWRLITKEVRRANRLFPRWPGSSGWSQADTRVVEAAVIAEEAGEVVKAALNLRPSDPHDATEAEYRTEIIQTAAMCVRALERMK